MSTIVKICGITNIEDARAALTAGADLLGFIFYPKSPRYVKPERVREILQTVRQEKDPSSARFVGVFVDESPLHISAMLDEVGLDYAQLHSEEPPDVLQQLHPRAFKALRPADAAEAQREATLYADLGPADGPRWMLDAYDPHAYGGTGKRADWHAAAALARQHPGLLLAGGLTPGNVADAMGTVRPWGVDVSSGVEIEPGRKDHALVRQFVQAVRAVDAR